MIIIHLANMKGAGFVNSRILTLHHARHGNMDLYLKRCMIITFLVCFYRSFILQIVLYSLSSIHKKKTFFSLKDHIYPFIDKHWDILFLKPSKYLLKLPHINFNIDFFINIETKFWRKTVKMTVASKRYAHLFESGLKTLKRIGFY